MWCKNVGTSFVRFVTMHAFDRLTELPLQYLALHYIQLHDNK